MDAQTMSPLLKNLGAKEIPRTEFIKKLRKALKKESIFPIPD
jgi:Leu/Phe-tRNA-protein transferase